MWTFGHLDTQTLWTFGCNYHLLIAAACACMCSYCTKSQLQQSTKGELTNLSGPNHDPASSDMAWLVTRLKLSINVVGKLHEEINSETNSTQNNYETQRGPHNRPKQLDPKNYIVRD